MDKTYAMNLMQRKSLFRESVKTNKSLFTTMITNLPIMENAYVLEAVDVQLTVDKLMVKRWKVLIKINFQNIGQKKKKTFNFLASSFLMQ